MFPGKQEDYLSICKVGSSTRSISKSFDLGKQCFSKMEIGKKKKVNHTTAVFTHTKWSGKLRQLPRWFQSKHPLNWNTQKSEAIIWGGSYFLAWIIQIIDSYLHLFRHGLKPILCTGNWKHNYLQMYILRDTSVYGYNYVQMQSQVWRFGNLFWKVD